MEAIKVRLASGQQGTLLWKPEEAEVAASGDMGYTWGSYESHSKTAQSKVSYGTYVTVWKKQDGQWKVVLSSASFGPAPSGRRTELGTDNSNR